MSADVTDQDNTKIGQLGSQCLPLVPLTIKTPKEIAQMIASSSRINTTSSPDRNGKNESSETMSTKTWSTNTMPTPEDVQMDLGLAYENLFKAQELLRQAAVQLGVTVPEMAVEVDESILGIYNIRNKLKDLLGAI